LAVAELAERARALPVSLQIAEMDEFRRALLAAGIRP
jgi:hypothetical protein